jgi:hypothetical protein
MNNALLGHWLIGLCDRIVLFAVSAGTLVRYPRVTMRYLRHTRRLPNVGFPRTIEDYFHWRKVFDHDPRFPGIADKLAVRDWLVENSLTLDAPRIVWRGTDASDIPAEYRGPEYVLKANHGSGWNIFFRQHAADPARAISIGNSYMARRYGNYWHETFYRDIEPELFVEEFLNDASFEMKFYTFRDTVTRVYVRHERLTSDAITADIWLIDDEGRLYLSEGRAGKSDRRLGRAIPATAHEALAIARRIGRHFDHVRVDFLSDGTRLWFSELTLTNDGGHASGMDDAGRALFDANWDIRGTWFMTAAPLTGWRRLFRAALARRLDARYRARD